MTPRQEVDALLAEMVQGQHLDRALEAIVDAVVARIEADPTLMHKIVRDTVQGQVLTGLWQAIR